jgi:osmotically-inducible protein OsmY
VSDRPRFPTVRRIAGVLLAALVLISSGGCAPILIGGAAIGTAVTLHDRRSPAVMLEDQQIELETMAAFMQNAAVRDRTQISAISYNRTLLLTGNADTAEIAEQATALASRVAKVQRVVDEITIGPRLSFNRQTEDAYIGTRVKAELLRVKLPGFDPTRVKVVTTNGVVYLMGLVTPEEADAAVERARYVPGVTRVVKLFEYISPDGAQKTPEHTPSDGPGPREPSPDSGPGTPGQDLDSEQGTHGSSESDIVEG